jgi:hypothetical protein
MPYHNLAWITAKDLKKYYTLRTTYRGARYEIDYPRQGWPNSFLSSDWYVHSNMDSGEDSQLSFSMARERDVREYEQIEDRYQDRERVYLPYVAPPERLERVPSPPYRLVYPDYPPPRHLALPTVDPQPLIEFRDTVGEIDMTLRSMNQQYREMAQNISRVATAATYAQEPRYAAGIGFRRPYHMLEPLYERDNCRRYGVDDRPRRRKRRLDKRYPGYVVKN